MTIIDDNGTAYGCGLTLLDATLLADVLSARHPDRRFRVIGDADGGTWEWSVVDDVADRGQETADRVADNATIGDGPWDTIQTQKTFPLGVPRTRRS